MEVKRKPFQGVLNIIRFNWHFYVIAGSLLIIVFAFNSELTELFQPFAFWLAVLTVFSIIISLTVSFYIYDLSDLYQVKWFPKTGEKEILNINAGFDETSEIIKSRNENVQLTICDFYDPEKHTEVSIKRARKAYPPQEGTIQVSTDKLPFTNNQFDASLAILSAHEIRDDQERKAFFKELNRVTKPGGKIFITEHLRDISNFIAYNVGFFHFHSKRKWLETFKQSGLLLKEEMKTTPFITTFILEKNEDTF